MTVRKVISYIVIAACVLWIARLTWFDWHMFGVSHHSIYLDGDQVHYDGMARLLLTKHVYNYWLHDSPAPMAMPGYPLFVTLVYKLAGLGYHRLAYLWLAQFVLYLISVVLIYRLGHRMQGPLLGALMAAILATMPFVFNEPFRVLTENLAVPAFLLYLNLLYEVYKRPVTTGWWITLGLSLGIMALIRPGLAELGLIPLILLIRRVLPTRNWKVVLLFLVFCAIPLVPWWIRNFIDFHHFILFDKGEAGNTMLAGTYPGYTSGPPNWNLAGVNQMALAKQRIIDGFTHHFWKYFMWFTVWRFHYNFDYIYTPLRGTVINNLKPLFIQYQRIIVWASIIVTAPLLTRSKFRQSFWMLLLYSNIVLILMLVPFHPEPRFAIYSVLLFGIVLIGSIYELLARLFGDPRGINNTYTYEYK